MIIHPWRLPTLTDGQPIACITPRQAAVLVGICHGHTSPEIAARLGVSEDTVKTHIRALLQAMQARSRAHAAALAASGQVTVTVRGVS